MTTPYPCLFVLDLAGEATDAVYFCSSACRAEFRGQYPDDRMEDGCNGEYIEDTRCTQCDQPLR